MATLLLAAQCLALAHRINHAPGSVQWLQSAAGSQADPGEPGQGASGHQAGDADCRLVDQLGHVDALCGAAVHAAAPLPAVPQVRGLAAPVVALLPLAAYQARAPPPA